MPGISEKNCIDKIVLSNLHDFVGYLCKYNTKRGVILLCEGNKKELYGLFHKLKYAKLKKKIKEILGDYTLTRKQIIVKSQTSVENIYTEIEKKPLHSITTAIDLSDVLKGQFSNESNYTNPEVMVWTINYKGHLEYIGKKRTISF